MDWFLYDNGLRHERVKMNETLCKCQISSSIKKISEIYNKKKTPGGLHYLPKFV